MYYVYHLIDSLTGETFYVGKGRNRRMYIHEYFVRTNRKFDNMHLFYKIRKILAHGGKIVYRKVFESNDEDLVLNKEREEINRIGRTDLKLGTLCNLTNGGEKNFGISDITRAKLRYPKTEEHKKKLSDALVGKIVSEETKEKLRNRTVRAWAHVVYPHHSENTKRILSEQKRGKSWEEIYGVEEANRRRERLKHRHKMGLMKADFITLSDAQKKNWVRRRQLEAK